MGPKKKPVGVKPNRKTDSTLAQFGIFNVPDLDAMEEDDGDSDPDDGELESELEALLSGKSTGKPKPQPKKAAKVQDIETLAAECMKDITSDDENDEHLSGDEELLAELSTLTAKPAHNIKKTEELIKEEKQISTVESSSVINILEERLALYKEAERASKVCGDNSRVRRYGRALKTLEDLLSSAKGGHSINEEEIPPAVTIPKPKTPMIPVLPEDNSIQNLPKPISPEIIPHRPAPMPDALEKTPSSDVPAPQIESISVQLTSRRKQYKMAAIKAKTSGDNETALKYVRIVKKFDAVIEAERNGQPVDLSNIPPPLPEFSGNLQMQTVLSKVAIHTPNVQSEKAQASANTEMEAAAMAAANEPEDSGMFSAPPPPGNVLEALQQRLEKYCITRDVAKSESNNSKVRRLNRIVQQYEGAIKNYKAGKPVAFEELPTPPGFAPIPHDIGSSVSPPNTSKNQPVVPPRVHKNPSQPPPVSSIGDPVPISTAPTGSSSTGRPPKLQRTNTSTVLEKQLNFLLERQKLFRQAALESKKKDDIQQAKEYLRMSKGFDSMIEATKCGLPIDATTIPTPPQLETDYVIIDKSECFDDDTPGSKEDLFRNLETELQHQIEMCARNKEHFLRLGDVSSASKFEKLGLESKKDLAVIQHQWRNEEPIPRFHYETRLFSMVQCHTDMGDNDLEVTIERGINLPGKPDDLDTFVKIELPIPTEAPQRAKTHTIRDTNNPIYQEIFKFEMNRKSRSQVRQFKRQALKLEVLSKGGFFRGDSILGTASVKLVDLESKCSIHDSFDLMDGRKTCGGKLEVKIRIRDPLLVKQVEEVREKWLVIGT